MVNNFKAYRILARKGLPRLFLCLAALALAVSGCTEQVTVYQVPGSGTYAASGKKILVMPFMDTRTFVDDNDPHKLDMGAHARSIFVAAVREHSGGSGVEILAPDMRAPFKSLTNAEVAEIGRRHGADIVVSGQVFSFTDTRAASIPARAGMFVRIVSAADGSLLFVGDHYQAASLPGASGGRELQARQVADRLVEGFLARAATAVAVAGRIASATALAVIAPLPVVPAANKSGGADSPGGNDRQPEPQPLPGLTGASLFSVTEWDEQFAPAAPPALDFDENFYSMPTVPPAEEVPPVEVDAPDAAIAGGTTADPANDESGIADAEVLPDAGDETADADIRDEDAMGDTAYDEPAEDEYEYSLDAAADSEDLAIEADDAEMDEPVAATAVVDEPAGEEAPAEAVVAEKAVEREEPAPVAVVTMVATEIDELPELDLGSIDTTPEQSELRDIAVAGNMSGDDLASDLFESEADLWTKSPRPGAASAPAPEAPVPAEFVGPDAGNPSNGEWGPFDFDPDTLELRRPASAAQPGPEPAAVADGPVSETAAQSQVASGARAGGRAPAARPRTRTAVEAEDGPVVSTPLVTEQPRTFKSVENELAADPSAALQSEDAKTEVPPTIAAPGAVRLLILPYHDRQNPNNLIPNTGGGEVVTTLFGTQLALDPNVQLLWDATGQATHDRLLGREDALEMGRLAGADYVVRGQVVEFRRAQSVPSLYSAVISTAVLAAQVFFAEMSGVDVATEVYRVSDGLCVMSRRDRAQQKYVVQAEKTVRRMATGMAESVVPAILAENAEEMDPLIDDLEPITVLTNPR